MPGTIRSAHLSVSFGGVRAVNHLDLDLGAGLVFGFLGPNGAGKSTTIRLLLGLLEAEEGSAAIGGHDVATDGDRARALCGVLLDDVGLYDRLTGWENLDLAGRIAGMPAADRRGRTTELLEHIGLADRARERVGGWSMGMRKKLAVARAMYHRPPVVFLDEPTNGLDPMARRALREDIVGLAGDHGATVFVTTHDIDDADRMCDLVGVMLGGRLITTGSPSELRARAGSGAVRLRGTGFGDAVTTALRAVPGVASVSPVEGGVDVSLAAAGRPAAPLVAAAVAAGAGVERVDRADASLEDAFVGLVRSGGEEEAP